MRILDVEKLRNFNGSPCQWAISSLSEPIKGLVVVEDETVFFVSNDILRNGSRPSYTHGYKYGWDMTEECLQYSDFHILSLGAK